MNEATLEEDKYGKIAIIVPQIIAHLSESLAQQIYFPLIYCEGGE